MKHLFTRILLTLSCAVLLLPLGHAQCLPGWAYQAPVTINNTPNAAGLTDYQVQVTVNTAALVAASKMQATGSDIRFVDAVCLPLSYWIESGINTSATVIWVKVPAIAGSAASQIAMYYGNASAAAASNGETTFELFDDFEGSSLNATKWTTHGNPPAVANGEVQFSDSESSIIRSATAYASPLVSEAKVNAASGQWPSMAQVESGTFNGYAVFMDDANMYFGQSEDYSGTYQAYIEAAAPMGAVVGLWRQTWAGAQQTAMWPGGTLSLNSTTVALPAALQVAIGGMQMGQGYMNVDWIRARKHTSSEPTTAVGSERPNMSLATAVLVSTVCPGSAAQVQFVAVGSYQSGNVFTAQLSNAAGDFSVPTAIGMVAATGSATLNAAIPTTVAPGAGYRVRVVSSAPNFTGADNGADLLVNGLPVIGALQNFTGVAATGQCGALVTFAATVSGVPAPSVAYSAAGAPITSPHVFPIGTTTVSMVAANGCGADSKTFTVVVRDLQAPTIAAPASLTVPASTGQCSATGVALGTAQTTDNCSGTVVSNNAPASFPKGVTTITWTATDASGNQATATQRVTVVDTQRPVFAVQPTTRTLGTAPGLCTATGGVPLPTVYDNCSGTVLRGVRSDSQPLSAPLGKGYTEVTWTATDAAGNVSSFVQYMLVTDTEAPIARVKPVTVTLSSAGKAGIAVCDVDNGSSDNCCLVSRTVSPSTFTCANLGANTVTLTLIDGEGNRTTAQTTVTVLGSLPSAAITVVPASGAYTAQGASTLYLGYGPRTVTLQATAGGVRYAWSGPAGLSSSTVASPVFTASAAGRYTYCVTITNQFGCTRSATVTITVVDIRCGNGNGNNVKVLVCHNGHEICISINALPAHINGHPGDQLGSCGPTAGRAASPPPVAATLSEPLFEAYPNPFREDATLHFQAVQAGPAQLRVFNALGQLVATLYDGEAQPNQSYQVKLSGEKLPDGIYTCRLALNGKVYTQRISLTK